jgi:hypothetical protein
MTPEHANTALPTDPVELQRRLNGIIDNWEDAEVWHWDDPVPLSGLKSPPISPYPAPESPPTEKITLMSSRRIWPNCASSRKRLPMQYLRSKTRLVVMLVSAVIPVVALWIMCILPGHILSRERLLAGLIVVTVCSIPHLEYWLQQALRKRTSHRKTDVESIPASNRMSLSELPPEELKRMVIDLESPVEADRRRAVQAFADLGTSPIPWIECWPDRKCTGLQLAAAEALIHEWVEAHESDPEASNAELIHELFPIGPKLRAKPRCRKSAEPVPNAPPAPPSVTPSKLSVALDRLNDVVKESILDFSIGPEPNEFATPEEEDVRLNPLDRNAFENRLRTPIADALEVASEILAKPATDRDLAASSEELGKVTDALRWTALEIAMDLRTQQHAGNEIERSLPAKESRSWAKKFRLMRAAGF